MKKIAFLILAIIGLMTINSCKKDKGEDPVPNKEVRAEKTNVKTYEIINLVSYENLANQYNATFGSAAIELLKTSDSTLTFYVPDIPEGEASLEFDLATIKFNVTKTAEVSASQLITNFTQNFEAQVSSLNPATPDQITEINSLNQYKQEVISLFNSLSDEEKRQAVLFYEANKEIFQSFANNTFTNLDASTTMRLQSECPRTDFNSFYGCTAENLGDAAIGLKNASKEFLKMLGLAGVMAGVAYNTSVLGPVAWGITAVGISLPLGTAGYLLITEVRPAALHFKHSLFPFLEANWIFSKALFIATTEVFQDQISTSLNLSPKFRSLTSNDANINSGSGYFISAMTSLSEYWNKLTAIFGNFPAYKNTEESTTLGTNDVSISNISNSNVQYQGNTGQSVKFKSLSGSEENFDYKITVSKEGFVEEKTVTGKVLASDPCDNGSMTAPVITGVNLECNTDNEIAILISFTANGTGALIGGGSGSCDPNSTCYPTRLYFLSPGATEYYIGYNSYYVTLKSGNANGGVIEITLTGSGSCINGQSAAQSLESFLPNYEWKVELMNQCNQRSNQVSF